MKAIILKGISACGKSTYAKELHELGYIWINRDNLRIENNTLKEKEIGELEEQLVIDSSQQGYNIVVDNTHLNQKSLDRIIDICKQNGYETEIVDCFQKIVTGNPMKALYDCMISNISRADIGGIRIPDCILYEQYLKSGYSLGENPVVIVDLDGTLYNIQHRLHYVSNKHKNYDKFMCREEIEKDIVYEQVKTITNLLSGTHTIVLLSGRKNTACAVTMKNLDRDKIKYDALLMRNSRDNRQDYIIKKEFLDLILMNHKVFMAIDDRKQVLDMWKEHGIYTMNVCQLDSNDF